MIAAMIAAIKAGFLEKAGEWSFERVRSFFWNKRKKPRRRDDNVTIGVLQNKVQNLLGWKKEITLRLRSSEKREASCHKNHQACVQSLAEARTQINDLYLWRKSVEKKIG